jgi:hypothetical protein
MVSISRGDWWLATVRGAAFAGFLWWLRERRVSLAWFGGFMLLLTADLFLVGRELKPTFPKNFFAPPPVASTFPPEKAAYRIFHEPDWYGGSDIAKKYFGTGRAVYWIVRNGLYPMTPASWGFRSVMERDYDKTALLPTVDFADAMWRVQKRGVKNWAEIFMSMSNGWYRGAFVPFDEEAKRVRNDLRRAQPIRFTKVAENPRYYFATELVRTATTGEFVEKLLQKSWPARVAFVDVAPFRPAPGRVKLIREKPNEIELELEAAGRAFFIAANTAHKYWTATLDGEPAPIRTTNIAYQGVEIPAGRHTLVLRYRNPVVAVSVWISAIAVLMALGLSFVRPAARFPEPPPHSQRVGEHPGGIADDAHAGIG